MGDNHRSMNFLNFQKFSKTLINQFIQFFLNYQDK